MTTLTERLTAAAGESAPRISHETPNDVYAELDGGGSVSIEEIPEGQWAKAGQRLDDDRRGGPARKRHSSSS